ncbi:MAG TPA: DUF4912 domain-containing protein, partial [Pyrinomonadaceae bacterium]|nr:DUF4912 domain-containing protein [Pyrinomonadaceae bacterium]
LPENHDSDSEEIILEDFQLDPISYSSTVKKPLEDEDDLLSLDVAPPDFLAKDLEETTEETEAEVDPIFAELAAPKLPELAKENRARLQMQSPNRLFFYWSVKNNPFQTLSKVLNGNRSNYQLVVKFINRKNGYEQIFPVEAEGNYWFNAESDSSYQAEVGFYASNRPYFRIMFSNVIETPRKSPSPRQATEADWAVSAKDFAKVLDESGFKFDAFEVALAGDEPETADFATQNALNQLLGGRELNFSEINTDEVRFALLALASGVSLDELRGQISEALFLILQEHYADLSAEKSLAALQENFDIYTEEIFEEETIGAAVYGLSLVNFPKSLRKRVVPKTRVTGDAPTELLPTEWLSKISPLSSSNLGK